MKATKPTRKFVAWLLVWVAIALGASPIIMLLLMRCELIPCGKWAVTQRMYITLLPFPEKAGMEIKNRTLGKGIRRSLRISTGNRSFALVVEPESNYLIEVINDPEADWDEKSAAVNTLWFNHDRRAVPCLKGLLVSDEGFFLKVHAAAALATIGDASGPSFLSRIASSSEYAISDREYAANLLDLAPKVVSSSFREGNH